MTEYWFARRFPIGDHRRSMAPVHWKGWLVAWGFVGALTIGALAFAWLGASGRLVDGGAAFALCAFIGGVWFISTARVRSDPIRTVKDYERGKLRV